MRIVVGVTGDSRSADAIAYAVQWARATRSSLVVTSVMPRPWPVNGAGPVDAEWTAYLQDEAQLALDRAAEAVPLGVEAEYVIGAHGGSGRGLAAAASGHDGRLVVIGSAADAAPGTVRIGTTGDQLVHGAGCPVTLVPVDYAKRPVAPLDRVSVAYAHSVDSASVLVAMRQVVGRTRLPVRLVTLLPHPPRHLPGAAEALGAMRADARLWLEQARASVPDASAEIAEGDDVGTALASLDWQAGETLLVGSAGHGPLARVFLGDTAARIMRAATVPVTVLPRGVEPELESTTTIPRLT
jgi:nucleotide-binding universal stress UspA family protein